MKTELNGKTGGEVRAQAETICPVCGSRDIELVNGIRGIYDRDRRYSIRHCRLCGLGMTSPFPSASEVATFYAASYNYPVHRIIAREKRGRSSRLLARVDISSRRILEIGCMYGDLLVEARRRGATETLGVEPDADARTVAASNGLNVVPGIADAAGQQFDVIVLQHVFEHLANPDDVLRQLGSMLAPEGRLLLAVPTMSSRTRRVFSRHWGWYQLPAHLYHYSDDSIGRMMERAGFRMEVAVTRGSDSLMLLATLLNLLGVGGERSLRVKPWEAILLRLCSFLWRWYEYVGDEELIVACRSVRESARTGGAKRLAEPQVLHESENDAAARAAAPRQSG